MTTARGIHMPLSNMFRILSSRSDRSASHTPVAAQSKLQHQRHSPISECHSTHICLFSYIFVVIYTHSLSGPMNPQLKVKVSPSYATLAQRADGGGWSKPCPSRYTPRISGTHCTAGWVGPRAGLDGYEKRFVFRTRIRTPKPSSTQQVATPNALRPLTPNERVR
jgi:hypothetical protein